MDVRITSMNSLRNSGVFWSIASRQYDAKTLWQKSILSHGNAILKLSFKVWKLPNVKERKGRKE